MSDGYATRDDLKRDRVTTNTQDYTIPGVGKIMIRGLSRAEFLLSQKKYPDDILKQERYTLSRAVMIPSGVTEADVEGWQSASGPEEINKVAMAVNALSGIGKGADKSDLPAV